MGQQFDGVDKWLQVHRVTEEAIAVQFRIAVPPVALAAVDQPAAVDTVLAC